MRACQYCKGRRACPIGTPVLAHATKCSATASHRLWVQWSRAFFGALGGSHMPLDQSSSRRGNARRAVCSLDNDPTGTLLVTIRQVRHLMGARDEQPTWYTEAAE